VQANGGVKDGDSASFGYGFGGKKGEGQIAANVQGYASE
jgi:hypothetical protein